ncbi:MAG TPA: type II secretion system protein [Gemmatimonadales bacterium]|nr:type II secretion system protein [Gemmatimonadales bacterium]
MRMNRRGFTMIELALTLSVLAIVTAMVIVGAGGAIRRSKVDRAASVVAADMEQAFSIAGRLRRPVRVVFPANTRTYQVVDASDGTTIRLTRDLGADAPHGVSTLEFLPDDAGAPYLTILPPGRSNTAVTVRLRTGDRERQVRVSTAGFVRVLP